MKTNTLLTHPSHRRTPRQPGALRCALVMALLLLAGLFTPARAANAPAYLSYQGYLTKSDGTALPSGTYDVIFRVYKVGTGGTQLWSEQQAVTVSDGAFSVLLGEGAAVSDEANSYASFKELFSPQRTTLDRYVGITVDEGLDGSFTGDTEITPRLQLVTTPFAFMADTAAQLQDGSVVYDFAESKVTINQALTVDQAGTFRSGLIVTGAVDTTSGGVLQVIRDDAKMILDENEVQSKDAAGNAAALYLNGDGGGVTIGKSTSANTIRGNTTLAEAATLSSSLTVEGATTLKGSTTINGAATLDSNLTVAGNLGVGTTSPEYPLTVEGTAVSIGLKNTIADSKWQLQAGSGGDFQIIDRKLNVARVTVLPTSGYVGIGLASPSFPLEISGAANSVDFNLQAYLDSNGAANVSRDDTQAHSIVASGRMRASAFDVKSDARIKAVIGAVDGGKALDTINRLKVTDYRMRDTIAAGHRPRRGFIAQEIEAVLPDVVRKSRNTLPDIFAAAKDSDYDAATKTLTVQMKQAHTLVIGDKVRLMNEKGPVDRKVLSVPSPNQFVVGEWAQPAKRLFVYGKEVTDFRTIDYDQIFTTGIAAIQEVNRKLEQSNKQLQSEVATIRGENARLSEQLASVMSRLQSLESLVQ